MGEKREERILCYTRMPMEDAVYSAKLADSMHLALVDKEGVCTPLNHNSGILYAKAVQNQDGTLQAKSLKNFVRGCLCNSLILNFADACQPSALPTVP